RRSRDGRIWRGPGAKTGDREIKWPSLDFSPSGIASGQGLAGIRLNARMLYRKLSDGQRPVPSGIDESVGLAPWRNLFATTRAKRTGDLVAISIKRLFVALG
ncbi:MAG: hypothetical protein AAFY76_06650, partial [Cyanobacteria bacterium J06649_11]